MLFNTLDKTARKDRRRVGRGIAAGQGKTAGRGTKGQASRSGYGIKTNFEGGQTPLVQRLPKLKGFKSQRIPTQEVKVGDLEAVSDKTVTTDALKAAGLIKSTTVKVKVIGGGTLTSAKNVEVQAVSAGAEKSIINAGGSVQLVDIGTTPEPAK